MIHIEVNIPERLIICRQEAGLTRSQVADLLGCSVSAISYYENGKRQLTGDLLLDFIRIYKVPSISAFFGEKPIHLELSEKEKDLIDLYRTAPTEAQKTVTTVLKSYRKEDKK